MTGNDRPTVLDRIERSAAVIERERRHRRQSRELVALGIGIGLLIGVGSASAVSLAGGPLWAAFIPALVVAFLINLAVGR